MTRRRRARQFRALRRACHPDSGVVDGPAEVPVFQPLGAGELALSQRIKHSFDPTGF